MNTKTTKRSTPKHTMLGLFALLALIVSVGIFSSGVANAADGAVSATGAITFSPDTVTINVGDKVNFTRTGSTHTATSAADGTVPFNLTLSSTVTTGSTPTFPAAGTYYYYCSPHSAARTSAQIAAVFAAGNPDGEMVGRIIVQAAPVADNARPTVSGVAASPNPTDGAGSVTLTGTINDTAPAGATASVAGAEWSKGGVAAAAGAGTAMAAADGTFGAATEGVTASVPISEAVGSTVTLWVRGRDAAGNWTLDPVSTTVTVTDIPAGAVQASVSVSGGNLANTAQNITFPGVTLNGTDQTVAGTTAPAWAASDARGSGLGWNVTITSQPFSGAGGTIPVTNFKTQLTAVTTVSGNTAPTPSPASFTSLSSVTPLKLLSAAVGAGMGSYTYTPAFQLTVPGSAGAGSYTAAVSVSVNSGPG